MKERALLNASLLVPFDVLQGHEIHGQGIPRIRRDRDKPADVSCDTFLVDHVPP